MLPIDYIFPGITSLGKVNNRGARKEGLIALTEKKLSGDT
jgi:hypothetical protein